MQAELTNKPVEERLLLIDERIATTLFSNNPFAKNFDLDFVEDIKDLVNKDDEIYSSLISVVKESERSYEQSSKKNQLLYALRRLKKNPSNPYLLNNMGLAYIAAKEYDKAIKCFEEALKNDEKFINAKMNIASIKIMQGMNEEAKKIYSDLLELNSSNKSVKINLANIFILEENFSEAEKLLNEVWENEKKNVDAGNKLAVIYIINKKNREAISVLRSCLKIDTNNPYLLNNIGIAYLASGLYKKALNAFSTSSRLFPTNTKFALNYLNLMLALRLNDEAIKYGELLLDQNYDKQVAEFLVEAYLKNSDLKLAVRIMKQIIAKENRFNQNELELARLYNNLGVIYFQINEKENAEKMYQLSLKLSDYNKLVVINNLVDLYLEQDKVIQAGVYIDLIEDRFPEENIHLFYKGIVANKKNDFQEAIQLLTEFLSYRKEFLNAYLTLSYIYSEHLHDYKMSIEILRQVPHNLRDNRIIINDLAYYFLMNDDIDAATNELKKVDNIEVDPFLTATKGLLEFKKGNITEGSKLYNDAKKIARSENLKIQIEQKKNLELARIYLHSDVDKARKRLNSIVLHSSKETVFSIQAKRMLEELKGG